MLRSFLVVLTAAPILSASVMAQGGVELQFDVEFESYFDNREFANDTSLASRSGTEFGARLMPSLGLVLGEGAGLMLGAELMLPYGDNDLGAVSRVMPVAYFGFDKGRWSAAAGLFPRSRMNIGSYSTAFFSEDYLFTDNLIGGLMGQLRGADELSFAEFVLCWEGIRTSETRERFRMLSAGRRYVGSGADRAVRFYGGYNLSVTHFAGQDAEDMTNVVDNILVNPAVGAEFMIGGFAATARLGWLQSLQQDRTYGDGWDTPGMGEICFGVSRWGLTLEEQLYIGKDLMPYYGGQSVVGASGEQVSVPYGALLYTGDLCFSTRGGFYNRASVGFERSFYSEQLRFRALFVTHVTSSGFATEQIVELNVKLGGALLRRGGARR